MLNKPKEMDLIKKLVNDPRLEGNVEWIAYIMATVQWETAQTFEPVREAYWLSEGWRKRNLRYYPWYGRGYVQITWKENYVKADRKIEEHYKRIGKKTPVHLDVNPDQALDPEISYEILVQGMIEGWFTGKDLDDYINEHGTDYVRARRIINGNDKAQTIAGIARQYEKEIRRIKSEMEEGVPEIDKKKSPGGIIDYCSKHTVLKKASQQTLCTQAAQQAINKAIDYYDLAIEPLLDDGIFGQKTHDAVISFQKIFCLDDDGIVGNETWEMLEIVDRIK